MIKKHIKYLLLSVFLLSAFNFVTAQNRIEEIRTNSRLGVSYYKSKDFEKAAPLLLEVYNLSRNIYYFRLHILSLMELDRYDEAEKKISSEIKNRRSPDARLYIIMGYVLKAKKLDAEAEKQYNKALEIIPVNKGGYILAANTFFSFMEYEWAAKVYRQGRKLIPKEDFTVELARMYMYLRDYEKMMEEYLNLVRRDEKRLRIIESSLAVALRNDLDNGLRDRFRKQVLKRIQAEPGVIGYNRLLIWFLLQERNFSGALRQSIALDRRTGKESSQIFELGNMAINNKEYSAAKQAFDYLTDKGENDPFYKQALMHNIHAAYYEYLDRGEHDIAKCKNLALELEKGLNYLGYSAATLNLISQYSYLLAFHMDEIDKAISIMDKGLEIPRLKPEESENLKADKADIYVYAGDTWEAVLIYSQVIDAAKDSPLSDEVKLRKARLSYYMGNFSWAKAQLDVLKASTSKLTANDAMELSMLIGNNLNLDTTEVPLRMFARADLLFFRNKDSLAMATLDSLTANYPYHSLVDDILFRKSRIEIRNSNYLMAAGYLEKIRSDFGYEMLADDAIFMLAELYNYHLDRKAEAKDLYREILSTYPGSVFVKEARKKFRELREIYPDELPVHEGEDYNGGGETG